MKKQHKYLAESGKFFDNIQIAELVESLEGGNRYKCIIIKPGITSSANTYTMHQGRKIAVKKRYPETVLMEAAQAGMFEGASMILRSEDDHLKQENGDVKNAVGYFTETKWNDEKNYVEGILNIKQSKGLAGAFRSHLKKLWESTKNIGLSITGFGEWVIEKINNEYVATVTSLQEITSVDPCRVGNAGGKIISLVESELNIKNNFKNQNNFNMNAKQLAALFLFLVAAGKIGADVKQSDMTEDQILEAATQKDMAKFFSEYKEEATPAGGTGNEGGSGNGAGNEGGSGSGEDSKEELLAKSIAEVKRVANEYKFKTILSEAKNLNQKVKDMLEERYKKLNYEFNEADLRKELIVQAKIIAEATEASFFKGVNQSLGTAFQDPKLGMEQDDKYMLGMEYLLSSAAVKSTWSDEDKKKFREAGVTGLISMRDYYKELTGDWSISGKEGRGKLAEAISTSSYTELLGVSMNKVMVRAYRMKAFEAPWRSFVKVVPRSDFKTNTLVYVGGYGDLPAVSQGADYQAATTPAEQANTYAVSKRGYLETITREAIFNDDLGAFQKIPTRVAEAASRTLSKFAFNFIISNSGLGATMGYDSKALFHADHNNILSSALDATSLLNARIKFFNQVDLTNSEKLGIYPKFLLVPIELSKTAYDLTTPAVNQNNQVPNYVQSLNCIPITIPHTTDTNDWYLVGDPLQEVPTIEIGFLNGKEEPEIFRQDEPTNGNVFLNDKITFKIRHEYSGAVENHIGFVGSIVA